MGTGTSALVIPAQAGTQHRAMSGKGKPRCASFDAVAALDPGSALTLRPG
jgi:hypothetical protein